MQLAEADAFRRASALYVGTHLGDQGTAYEPLPLFVAAAEREMTVVAEQKEPVAAPKENERGTQRGPGLHARRPEASGASDTVPTSGSRALHRHLRRCHECARQELAVRRGAAGQTRTW